MDELFEKLKAEPPVKSFKKDSRRSNSDNIDQSPMASPPPSRYLSPPSSSPSPFATTVKKFETKSKFSKSHSSAKDENASVLRHVKVLLERTSLSNLPKLRNRENTEKSTSHVQKKGELVVSMTDSDRRTPTKRKRPLSISPYHDVVDYGPSTSKAAQEKRFKFDLKQKRFKVKNFKVRIRRSNLLQLQQNLLKQKTSGAKRSISSISKTDRKETSESTLKRSNKSNTAQNDSAALHPSQNLPKRARSTGSSPASRLLMKLSSSQKNKPETITPTLNKYSKSAQLKRSHLIMTFGKRFFSAYVKLDKCSHPVMVAFESNLRTCKRQSKNLSVSFKETVEVLGGDVDYSDEDNDHSSNRTTDLRALYLGQVTPTRLEKADNSKAADASLFVVPTVSSVSTPIMAPERRKSVCKSYSPLKDDTTPSPSRERLKLANEKLPPNGIRFINLTEEDDEEEYIVPDELELPTKTSNIMPAFIQDDQPNQKKPDDSNGSDLNASKADSKELDCGAEVESAEESYSKTEENPGNKRKIIVTTAIDVEDELSAKDDSGEHSKPKDTDAIAANDDEVTVPTVPQEADVESSDVQVVLDSSQDIGDNETDAVTIGESGLEMADNPQPATLQQSNSDEVAVQDAFMSPISVINDETVEKNKANISKDNSEGTSPISFASAEEVQQLHGLVEDVDDTPTNPADNFAQYKMTEFTQGLVKAAKDAQRMLVAAAQTSAAGAQRMLAAQTSAADAQNILAAAAQTSAADANATLSTSHNSTVDHDLSLHLFVEDEENGSVDEIVKETINKLRQDLELTNDSVSQTVVNADDVPTSSASK